MLYIDKESTQHPQAVLDKAVMFFCHSGPALRLAQQNDQSLTFVGGGGYVTVTATPAANGDPTLVDIESREWEFQVRQFLRDL